MEEKRNRLLAWVKAHKKQLAITGISASVLVLIVLGLKNKDSLEKIIFLREKRVKKVQNKLNVADVVNDLPIEMPAVKRAYTRPETPFDVTQHIRILPECWRHSAEKEAEAARLGNDLLTNQTIVDTYPKYVA